MDHNMLLYVALSRMVREHDELTKFRATRGDPPCLTNECMFLAKKAISEYETEVAGFQAQFVRSRTSNTEG